MRHSLSHIDACIEMEPYALCFQLFTTAQLLIAIPSYCLRWERMITHGVLVLPGYLGSTGVTDYDYCELA